MATRLDNIADQLVHEPDDGPWFFGITEYLLQGLIVLGTFGAWIVSNRQDVAHTGFWIMWLDIDCAIISKPELAVGDVDHRWRVIVDMKKVILARLQHDKKSESFVDQGLRMRFGRQRLGRVENDVLKNFV